MYKTLLSYLTSNPILAKHNLSEQEISDLADYIINIFPSAQVEEVIRMVEEVIAINPTLSWKEILETVARKVVEFLHAEAATIRVFDPETGRLVAFGSYQYIETGRLKDMEDGAHRELREEIGMSASTIQRIGEFYLAPGYSTEILVIFLATGLRPYPLTGDEDEFIQVKPTPIAQAYARVESGQIRDAKTLAALLLARPYL